MELPSLFLVTATSVLGGMILLWATSVVLRDTSVVDAAWGPLFVVVASLGLGYGEGWIGRRILLAVLVGAWGLRLGVHLALRNRRAGEDPRYARWREEHGSAWPLRSLFTVFLLQGAILLVVALPVVVAQGAAGSPGWRWTDVVGTAVFLAGFLFEVVADEQLRRFRRERTDADQLLTGGVWRYSRHPNYFGEAVLWWGLWIVALGAPWGWTTAAGPIVLTLLLLRVSGVPLTEARMADRPGFRAWVRRTSAFVPRPPKEPEDGSRGARDDAPGPRGGGDDG